jgi:hypothetical protein
MIYLDFEGFVKEQPSLVGYKFKGHFKQIVMDPILKKICSEYKVEYLSFDDFCNFIVDLAVTNECPLVGYSNYEKDILEQSVEQDFNYFDIKKFIKRKVKVSFSERHQSMDEYWYGEKYKSNGEINPTYKGGFGKKRWKLTTMLNLFEYPGFEIANYGSGKSTQRLSSVIRGLKTKRGYLTSIQKRNFTNLLKHNRIDVEGIEHLYEQL